MMFYQLARIPVSTMPTEVPQELPPPTGIAPPPALPPVPRALRWALHVFAVLCLALGVIGIFVPGLPTTVFILMAAWAAARSSPRLHEWLWYHRLFGPMLRDWARGGWVSRRAKWNASFLMALCAALLVLTVPQRWAAVAAIVSMACVLTWLWCRPEPPAKR